MKKYNIPRRDPSNAKKIKNKLGYDLLSHLYTTRRISSIKLGKKFNLSSSTVFNQYGAGYLLIPNVPEGTGNSNSSEILWGYSFGDGQRYTTNYIDCDFTYNNFFLFFILNS